MFNRSNYKFYRIFGVIGIVGIVVFFVCRLVLMNVELFAALSERQSKTQTRTAVTSEQSINDEAKGVPLKKSHADHEEQLNNKALGNIMLFIIGLVCTFCGVLTTFAFHYNDYLKRAPDSGPTPTNHILDMVVIVIGLWTLLSLGGVCLHALANAVGIDRDSVFQHFFRSVWYVVFGGFGSFLGEVGMRVFVWSTKEKVVAN
jgi:hypothetical protein